MNTLVLTLVQLLYFAVHFEKGDGSRGGRGGGGVRGIGMIGYDEINGTILQSINRESSYVYSTVYQRTYFYGSRYYSSYVKSVTRSERRKAVVCKYVIGPIDEFFNMTYEDDQTRVAEIFYECDKYQHCCEGLDCCNTEGFHWWNILFVVSGLVLSGYFCIYCALFCSEELTGSDEIGENAEDTNDSTSPDALLTSDATNVVQFDDTPFFRHIASATENDLLPTYAQANNESPPSYSTIINPPYNSSSYISSSSNRATQPTIYT